MSDIDPDLILVREMEEVAACRICLDRGDPDGHMCLPCNCAGSIKYVHPDCLKEWIKASGSIECEICHSLYKRQWMMWAYENNLIRTQNANQGNNQNTQANDLIEETSTGYVWKVITLGLLVFFLLGIMMLLIAGTHIMSEDAADFLGISFRVLIMLISVTMIGFTVAIRRNLGLSILQGIVQAMLTSTLKYQSKSSMFFSTKKRITDPHQQQIRPINLRQT